MIKYYIRTFHRLPPSKWIFDDPSEITPVLDEMISKRPCNRKARGLDLLNSVAITEFDTEKVENWRQVFIEFKDWDWIDLGSIYK